MRNENKLGNRLKRIESQVFQIKVLLIVMIAMYILTFYGEFDFVVKVIFWAAVIVGLIYIIMVLIDKIMAKKAANKMNKKFQEMIDKTKTEQQKQDS